MGGLRNALKQSMSPGERKLITFIIWGRVIHSGKGISKRIGGWMLTGKWVRFPYTPQNGYSIEEGEGLGFSKK